MSDDHVEGKPAKPKKKRVLLSEEPKRIFTEKHHALFRPPQGHDWQPEKFERIYVARRNREGDWEEVTEWFPPEELQDLKQIQERWGGGVYRLRAIRYDGTVYRTVETARIPGPPKPLYYVEPEEDASKPEAPAPISSGGGSELLGIFQVMLAESRAANERMMTMMQQSTQMMMQMQQHSTEVLVAALGGNRLDVPGMVSAIASAVKPPVIQAPDVTEQVGKFMEVAKKLQPPAAKEESIGEIVGAAVQGLGALAAVQAQTQAMQPKPASAPPPQSALPNGSTEIAG
jgi:hypothetical protein